MVAMFDPTLPQEVQDAVEAAALGVLGSGQYILGAEVFAQQAFHRSQIAGGQARAQRDFGQRGQIPLVAGFRGYSSQIRQQFGSQLGRV